MAALLAFTDVHAFYGAFHALKGVSLGFEAGQRVAIFGHNGSGKSTLMKCCVGAIETLTGAVSFDGKPIVPGAVPQNVQLGIGFVPQSRNVFKDLPVERNLLIAGLTQGNQDLEAIWDLFPALRGRRNQLAGTMSGGEQQMVAFGMALMTRPRLLLLDEPTTGLSPVMANLVLRTVDRVSRDLGIGILIIEQNVPRTLNVVDRALIIKSGRIISDGPAAALHGRHDLWDWF
jgi:branched-chain amino acid transport system ATP-binding protein